MYNDEMIENVREYLNEHNDVAVDCLVNIGEGDWCEVFSLDDLYNYYCGGELDSVINLFVDRGMNATSYYRYYVKDDEVNDEDDMCYDIENVLDDDDTVEMIIDDILNWNITIPDELYKMCKPIDWDTVKERIHDGYSKIMNGLYQSCGKTPEGFEIAVCTGSIYKRIRDCLITTKAFGAIEDDYVLLEDVSWTDAIDNITVFCKDFCKGGVTVEKAVEVWIKNNVLEG